MASVTLGKEETLVVNLRDLTYIPAYREYEEERPDLYPDRSGAAALSGVWQLQHQEVCRTRQGRDGCMCRG